MKKQFTLIELLVVIAIIAILAASQLYLDGHVKVQNGFYARVDSTYAYLDVWKSPQVIFYDGN